MDLMDNMREKYRILFFMMIICTFPSQGDIHGYSHSGRKGKHQTRNYNLTIAAQLDIIKDNECAIKYSQTDVDLYKTQASENNKLIYLYFGYDYYSDNLLRKGNEEVFEPMSWIRVFGHHGKGFLRLRYHYEALSMNSLSIGVSHMNIKVTDLPIGCLANQSTAVIEILFRESILTDFRILRVNDTSLRTLMQENSPENVHACQLRIRNNDGKAIFFYLCCRKDSNGNTVCSELEYDVWFRCVIWFIFSWKIAVFMFLPYAVPQSFYVDKKITQHYEQEATSQRCIRILKTIDPKKSGSCCKNILSYREVVKHMPNFRRFIEDMSGKTACFISKVYLEIPNRDLIKENDVPVGIVPTIFHTITRCNFRDFPSIWECCESNILGNYPGGFPRVSWRKCLSKMMTFIVICFAIGPWILRILFYFFYEKDHYNRQVKAAESRNLDISYPGNLCSLLTPFHAIFVLCYIFIVIDSLCYGFLLKYTLKHIRRVLQMCLRSSLEPSEKNVAGWCLNFLLKPCSKFGIFGLLLCFYWVFALPVAIAVALFNYLPTVKLTFCLLLEIVLNMFPTRFQCFHFAHQRRVRLRNDDKTKQNNNFSWKCLLLEIFFRIIVSLLCLASLFSVLFLLCETVDFLVEIASYTLMGVLLNSSHTMQFVSLLFMVVVYGYTTFDSVHKKYQCFNKLVHSYVLSKLKPRITQTLVVDNNVALQVDDTREEEIGESRIDFSVDNGVALWKRRRTILFIDKQGTPRIRNDFFFKCCEMDHFAAPGSLFLNLLNALLKFSVIIIFLVFVSVVVVAFGEKLKVSSTNQTLITLTGGFIPFVLTNFLFRKAEPAIVEEDVRFIKCINRIISEDVKSFKITDMECYDITNTFGNNSTPEEKLPDNFGQLDENDESGNEYTLFTGNDSKVSKCSQNNTGKQNIDRARHTCIKDEFNEIHALGEGNKEDDANRDKKENIPVNAEANNRDEQLDHGNVTNNQSDNWQDYDLIIDMDKNYFDFL